MMSSWGTKPRRLFQRWRLSTTSPLTRIVPLVFLTLPTTRFMSVVLPAPDAPMIAVLVHGSKRPDTPRMICTPLGSVNLGRGDRSGEEFRGGFGGRRFRGAAVSGAARRA